MARDMHPTMEADWLEAQAAAAGDEQARNSFWNRHVRAVRMWLWFRWSHRSLRSFVEDAAQEVFLECFRPGGALAHMDARKAQHGVVAFLRGIVRNVAHRIERTQARDFEHRRRLAVAAATPAPADAGAAEQIDRAWEHDRVMAALALLDQEDPPDGMRHTLREFLHAHFEDGLPVRKIAAAWQEKPEHVHELRRRACRRFRECLHRVAHAEGTHLAPEMIVKAAHRPPGDLPRRPQQGFP